MGKILKSNNSVGPNNRVGGKKLSLNNIVGGKKASKINRNFGPETEGIQSLILHLPFQIIHK